MEDTYQSINAGENRDVLHTKDELRRRQGDNGSSEFH